MFNDSDKQISNQKIENDPYLDSRKTFIRVSTQPTES